MKKMHINIPLPIKNELKALAKEKGTDLSTLIRMISIEYLKKEKERNER